MTDKDLREIETADAKAEARPPSFLAVGLRWHYGAALGLALVTLPFQGSIVARIDDLTSPGVSSFFPLFVLVAVTVPWVVAGYQKVYALVTGVDLETEDEDEDAKAPRSKAKAKARRQELKDAGSALDARLAHRAAFAGAGPSSSTETCLLDEGKETIAAHRDDEDSGPPNRAVTTPPDVDPNESALVDHYA